MVYSGLKEYIDKTINVLKEILPANAFLRVNFCKDRRKISDFGKFASKLTAWLT
jgi:hypothetical protein